MYKHISLKIGAILIVAVLLVPLAYSSIARADNGSQDREVSVDASNNGYFSIDSKSIAPPGHSNEFELVFAGNTLLMTFRNSTNQQNSSLEFAVTLNKLVYSTASGGNETLIDFGDSGFSLMDSSMYSNMSMSMNNNFNSSYREFGVYVLHENTMFAMIAQVNGAPSSVQTPAMQGKMMTLTPNEVKLSFIIINTSITSPMNLQTSPPVSGNISLQMKISAPSGIPPAVSTHNGFALNFTEGNNSGYFAWNKTAYVSNGGMQGWTRAVVGYSFSGQELTLTYPAAQKIVHDPTIGISAQTITSAVYNAVKAAGNIIIYGIALTLAIVLVAASAAYRRRN
ncbi:MAG: hypothetical protein KIS30_00265 [Thermoplasmata archaeon]|nr:hypothetical protein [Candidatus Sysuiplasma acidicola]MBX8645183.1 hypothetical protein [Candidatus Sysuiplasma acidicola]